MERTASFQEVADWFESKESAMGTVAHEILQEYRSDRLPLTLHTIDVLTYVENR